MSFIFAKDIHNFFNTTNVAVVANGDRAILTLYQTTNFKTGSNSKPLQTTK